MIRVAIFNNDNNTKFQKHLVNLLKREPDINVVAQTETGIPGIKVVEEQKPDVVLIDSKQPFTENLESTERIVSRFQDTKIIFLSRDSSEDSLTAARALSGHVTPFVRTALTGTFLLQSERACSKKGKPAMLRIAKQSRLNTDKIIAKASHYFGKSGEGLCKGFV